MGIDQRRSWPEVWTLDKGCSHGDRPEKACYCNRQESEWCRVRHLDKPKNEGSTLECRQVGRLL